MASTPKLVRFRMLLDQLNDTEFNQFITNVLTKCGRDIICTALFNQFSDQNHANSSQQTLDSMMTMTETILQSRTKNDTSDQNPPYSIQSLSTVLIGEIGSYFERSDYISFKRCQRATYIGCTSPCTLRALDLTYMTNYRLVDLKKYPQIRSLGLDLDQFDDLVLPNNENICTHLKRLELNNESKDDADIGGLLNQTALPFTAITHLKLKAFGDDQDYFPTSKILRLLSRFSNLQCLSMNDVYFNLDDSSISLITDHLPQLTTFVGSECDTDCLKRMMSAFGKQLEALEVDESDMEIPQNIRFEAMEELSICYSPGSGSVMDAIRESTKSLRRIFWSWGDVDESLVIDLLSEQKQLRQLVINANYRNPQKVCGALDRAIFNIRNMQKKRIEIELLLSGTGGGFDTSDIIYNLTKLVNTLNLCKIKHYSFRCCLIPPPQGIIKNLQSELRCLKVGNSIRYHVQSNGNEIMVTNNGNASKQFVFDRRFRGWHTDY